MRMNENTFFLSFPRLLQNTGYALCHLKADKEKAGGAQCIPNMGNNERTQVDAGI